jgi:protein PhnA
MDDESYVFDEETGDWMPTSELVERRAQASRVEVRDAVGNILADGDQVTLIKDLEVKGAGQTLRRGTLIKSIRLTGDAQEIDCPTMGSRGWFCAPSSSRSGPDLKRPDARSRDRRQ